MIGVIDFQAQLSHLPQALVGIAGVNSCETPRLHKSWGPVAQYALAATRQLSLADRTLPFLCLCGPTGATCEAFDGAWRRSSDGRLTGTDFGQHRYKRLHPFTLIHSLQNQVAAVLSMELGLIGPCLNFSEGPTSFADLLPLAAAYLLDHSQVLLVLASAGDRAEEQVKQELVGPGAEGLEGAVTLLLGSEARLGWLERVPSSPAALPLCGPAVLAPGLALIQALGQDRAAEFVAQAGDYSAGFRVVPHDAGP